MVHLALGQVRDRALLTPCHSHVLFGVPLPSMCMQPNDGSFLPEATSESTARRMATDQYSVCGISTRVFARSLRYGRLCRSCRRRS